VLIGVETSSRMMASAGGLFEALGMLVQAAFVIILTLEGWVEVYEQSAAATPWAWVFYASYIVVAVFVVINLFIAVVINNLEATRKEETAAGDGAANVLQEIERLRAQVDRVEAVVRRVGSEDRTS
jgi:voltage-gated sodium channel